MTVSGLTEVSRLSNLCGNPIDEQPVNPFLSKLAQIDGK